MKKVVFIDEVHPCLAETLQKNGFECTMAYSMDLLTILSLIEDAQGIVVRSRFRMDASFLDGAKQLEFIARSGAGMENIDLEYCTKRNIALFNAPEGNRNAVAEHALGMLLSLFNHLNKGDQEIRNGLWDREGNRGIELAGKTVGIIGYGNNGSQFAKVLRGFDVKILAYDKYKHGFGNEWVHEADMATIFNEADVVSLHIPQTPETINLLNKDFFNSFSKSIYLINLARGKIVNTQDLLNAIKTQQVLGACLDVLEFEKSSFEDFFGDDSLPNAFKELLQSKHVLLSPHVGGWTRESYIKLSEVLAEKILRFYSLS